MGYSFQLAARVLQHPTAFVTLVVEHWLEHEIAQWVHNDPSHHERTLLPRSYISLQDVNGVWK